LWQFLGEFAAPLLSRGSAISVLYLFDKSSYPGLDLKPLRIIFPFLSGLPFIPPIFFSVFPSFAASFHPFQDTQAVNSELLCSSLKISSSVRRGVYGFIIVLELVCSE
jgi:hypothetical protein